MLSTRRSANPSTCQPPRKTNKTPPIISSIIVHDANSTSEASYPFYPDNSLTPLSPCDSEGLRYELRTTVLGQAVPYYLSIGKKDGGEHQLIVDTAVYMTLPQTLNLQIALVDLYGDFIYTDFKLKITNKSENCSSYQIWSPIIQDFTYVVGSL